MTIAVPRNSRHPVLMAPALWIGLVLSVLLALYVARWERDALGNELHELAKERAQVLSSSMSGATEVLYSLASLHAATGEMQQEQFTLFARDSIRRHPELQAVEWIPRVGDAQRAAFEAHKQLAGYRDFAFTELDKAGSLIRAAQRAEYFPVYYVEPVAGNEPAHGFDLGADSKRLSALELARDSGLAAVTAPVRLAQETGAQQGFLMFYPLYSAPYPTDVLSRRSRIEGFALAVFRAGDLITTAFRDIAERGVNVTVFDTGDMSAPLFHQAGSRKQARWWDSLKLLRPAQMEWDIQIDVAGRRWHLQFEPTAEFANQRLPMQALTAFAVGIALTMLLVAYMASAARREQEISLVNTSLQKEIGEREKAIETAQAANRAKSDFLANMSHEIRTPLNAVLGYAQLLRRDARLDAEQRHSVNAIIVSGNHLLSQINAVLDFTKIETGRMEVTAHDLRLNSLLREMEVMFRSRCHEKGLVLRVQLLPPEMDAVHADGGKLRQILINLLGNAVRFTQGGEVFLRAALAADGRHAFDVIDTGPGIAHADLERIFEPFFQGQTPAQSGGTGLGLAIARRQARLMGGELTVNSEQGTGSRFTLLVALPSARNPQESDTYEAVRWRLPPSVSCQILIIDDVMANRDVLHRFLVQAGCHCSQARDHRTALEQLKATRFDLIFLDIRMPDGDGLKLLPQLQLAQPGVQVVAYTALAFEQDKQQCLDAGCQAFITKPVEAETVFRTLEKLLHVRFEREWAETEVPIDAHHARHAPLPAALHERLLVAAELHSSTALKGCLEELQELGETTRPLADRLRQLMRAYDMDGIARLLSSVGVEEVDHDSA